MNRKGFSLVEALVVAALMSIVGAGTMSMLKGYGTGVAVVANQARRDKLAANIYDFVSDPVNLRYSIDIADNTAFRACLKTNLEDGGGNDCTAGPFPIQVSSPDGQRISGTAAAPAYYNLSGSRCSVPDPNSCQMKATSRFLAICPSGAPCERAAAVSIVTTLEPFDQSVRIPNSLTLKRGTFQRDVSTKLILAAGNTSAGCGPGQFLRQVEYKDGELSPTCVSISVSCPVGKFLTGIRFDAVTGAPIADCAAPPPPPPPPTFAGCPSGQISIGSETNGAPKCTPAVLFGGGYMELHVTINTGPFQTCAVKNDITGACTCPPGFSRSQTIFSFTSENCSLFNQSAFEGDPWDPAYSPRGCGASSYYCYRKLP